MKGWSPNQEALTLYTLHTPRYRIPVRVYGYGFPRRTLLNYWVTRGNPPLRFAEDWGLKLAMHS